MRPGDQGERTNDPESGADPSALPHTNLALLATAIEQAGDAILITDAGARIRYVNPAFTLMTGYSAEEAIGQNPSMLKSGRQNPEFYRDLWHTVLAGSAWRGELINRRKDGTFYAEEMTITPVLDLTDTVSNFIAIKKDVTARKRAEHEIRKARDAAEAASRAKSQFLANMSHEIRTPMNGVIGMSALLLDTPLSPEQRQYAEIVHTSGKTLLAVINDILDFSKIEARKLSLVATDFNLHTPLREAVEMLAVEAHKKGLELTCEISSEVPLLLHGDPGRLRQILVNLLANAVKFTQAGEVALLVGVEAEYQQTTTLRFRVKDTGIGFPEDQTPFLFEPFVQADGSTTRKYGGTGLGLTIAKQLVEMMGGRIGAYSAPGHGSTFWFTVALEKQPHSAVPVPEFDLSMENPRVLVVDEHATNRTLVNNLLKRCGCRSEEAPNTDSALLLLHAAALAHDPFHVIFLDSVMPEANSEKLGQCIATDPEFEGIALVLMIPLGQARGLNSLTRLGFTRYLSKPVWQSTLYEALTRSLREVAREAVQEGVQETRGEPDAAGENLAEPSPEPCASLARVLIVDDNATNQQVAAAILRKLGHHTDVAGDGETAIESLRTADYDLVLMDCEMPRMDGYETARKIRLASSGVRNPGIPILALTAHAMRGDREKCIAAGMNDYLAKPIEPAQLAAILPQLLPSLPSPHPSTTSFEHCKPEVAFNPEELVGRLSGDENLAREIVAGFLTDVPTHFRVLQEMIASGDARNIILTAHTLKGAAATVAAPALRALCDKIEHAAAAGDLPNVASLLKLLIQQFERFQAALKQSGCLSPSPRRN
jgi:two-component system, sensor histidine kinase and response regulator